MTVKDWIRWVTVALLLSQLGACAAAGPSRSAPSVPPSSSTPLLSVPALVPDEQPSEPSPTRGSVTSPELAIAAVVAEQPQFAAYRLGALSVDASASPGRPGFGPPLGGDRSVFAARVVGGIRLIFGTGSGDCPSGCTVHRYDVFLVRPDGTVVKACVVDKIPIGNRDPCAGG